MKEKKPLGVILYQGLSNLDGQNIIVVATNVFGNKSNNEKIGDMIPIWILKRDISPLMSTTKEARTSTYYSDSTVCGDCKHRDLGSCYVTLFHGPDQVYRAFHEQRYVSYDFDKMKELFRDKKVRIGAYGDPAAVPMFVWDEVCGLAKNYTGYTHQWNNKKLSPNYLDNLKKYNMASCDTVSEQITASKMGWRTFRIRLPKIDKVLKSNNLTKQTVILDDEMVCPASVEGGRISSCDKCGACSGTKHGKLKNVCIVIHGADFKIDKFIDGIKSILNKKSWKMKMRKLKKKKRFNRRKDNPVLAILPV
jgi:hypothetical protein